MSKDNNLLASNEFLEAHAVRQFSNDENAKISLHEPIVLDMRARFVVSLLEKWGLVLAQPDGEDTAGRQKIRLVDPEEVVAHAVAITECAFAEIEKRGWLVNCGTYEKLKSAVAGV